VHLPRFFLYNFVRFPGVCKNGVVIVPSVLLLTRTLRFSITAEREYKWGYNGVSEDVAINKKILPQICGSIFIG